MRKIWQTCVPRGCLTARSEPGRQLLPHEVDVPLASSRPGRSTSQAPSSGRGHRTQRGPGPSRQLHHQVDVPLASSPPRRLAPLPFRTRT